MLHSPFGEIYYNAIKEKLNKQTKNGLFIIAVDPWAISSIDSLKYARELKTELGSVSFFNMNPNYDYLANSYKKSMFSLLYDQFSNNSTMELHKDGWLEVKFEKDLEKFERSKFHKVKDYRLNNLPKFKLSNDRLFWLDKTINLLSSHGKVVLIRIPVSPEMLMIENTLCKDFDSIIRTRFRHFPFMNYTITESNYLFIDGNHLFKESSKKFSEKLSADINTFYLNE